METNNKAPKQSINLATTSMDEIVKAVEKRIPNKLLDRNDRTQANIVSKAASTLNVENS